ncbi:hypothetical protein PHIN7_13440 [Polynucleobacter sp. HIN7]|nr:hypothetical protein PHIN7_13440 [Polynucleobacter sp. HIN7]
MFAFKLINPVVVSFKLAEPLATISLLTDMNPRSPPLVPVVIIICTSFFNAAFIVATLMVAGLAVPVNVPELLDELLSTELIVRS